MRDAVVVEAVRTPVGRHKGALAQVHPVDLLAHTLNALVERSGVDPALIEDVITGTVTQVTEQGANIGRIAGLVANLPPTVPGMTLNRMCSSSQQAIHMAAQGVIAGDMDLVVACGVESMTRVPMGSEWGHWGKSIEDKYEQISQGIAAERMVADYGFSRTELDSFSLTSHQRAIAARESGRFAAEIAPIDALDAEGKLQRVSEDEGPRANTSMERLGSLKSVFMEDGAITAGHASQISDGASALLITTSEKAAELGLKPMARIIARAHAGGDPVAMLYAIMPSTRRALKNAGLSMAEMDLIEVNEAFAPVVMGWSREFDADPEKINVNGGAIALGHPLGASGSRIATTLLHQMGRQDAEFGLHTMCAYHGLATTTIYQRLN
ncbi:MAG: thiolase family protein [Gammaproteobacteria bacterium]|nr:thiolase family protein [Gammaproteobacteria bacterium]